MISVVVPAHNATSTLDECLRALVDQTVPRADYEVIVVDDGSLDNTSEVAARYQADGVQLVRQQNQGPSGARNAGVAHSSGTMLLFTDSDCAPKRDWIERMLTAFDDVELMGAKGTYLTRQRSKVARFVQAEYEDRYDRMRGQDQIDFIDTYSAAYRRDVFLQNGGFDTSIKYLEDQEFSFRLAEKGYKLGFVPEAQVYHHHDQDILEYFERKFNIGVWKARIIQRYPERLASDSHTPPVLKLQLVLLLVAFPLLVTGFIVRQLGFDWWDWVAIAGVLALVAFFLSGVPFMVKTWRKDPVIGLISPGMIFLRAIALGSGYAIGSLRFVRVAPETHAVLSARDRLLKRTVDLVGAVTGLTLSAPLLVAIAVAVKIDSAGPVVFVQDRVGENGRPFQLVKFRTMVVGADERLAELVDLDNLEEPVFKVRDDPRVTRVGRFLRRFSLDELPQFLNVLRGEMSLVGPRPEEEWLVRLYNDRQRRRLAVKPGITGPMQINGRANLTLNQRLDLELNYIENYSLRRDLLILLKTLPAVVQGYGAY
ncbi:MAG: sugar transferase [Chloroflexota bacterium]|nr:sugar transferase [Chloroflexota bacterium]